MKLRVAAIAFASLAASGCDPGTLGLPVGDLRGVWVASAYEVIDNATRQVSVRLISEGGSLTLSIDQPSGPPRVSAVFVDADGGGWHRNGAVDPVEGTLTLDGVTYDIDHDDNDMRLFTSVSRFDFGDGAEPATVSIELRRF